jgi:hypothetical protein
LEDPPPRFVAVRTCIRPACGSRRNGSAFDERERRDEKKADLVVVRRGERNGELRWKGEGAVLAC